ncbi:MAG: class I SAM-dependent methyltransferase [Terriglobia bacterium]
MEHRLDLGCGLNKAPGSIGVDSNRDATAADILADLNRPLPFADSSFDEVRAVHVIEHVHDIMRTIAEIHRVARSGGRVYLVTPHYTDSSSWRDPTHCWHLNTYSFRFWTARGLHHERHWYTRLELREIYFHVELARLWKCTGFQWLVNRFECFRRFWEQYLCFVIRAKQMEFAFEVVKSRRPIIPLPEGQYGQ